MWRGYLPGGYRAPMPSPVVTEMAGNEHVVLLDESGRATGTADKAVVHTGETPLHLAFSCYLVRDQRLLVTRRALAKRTFPGLWTNSVCGHPALGEPLFAAVQRRARGELGLAAHGLRVVLPGFRYRAQMDGVEENEICPVLVGEADGHLELNPDEVDSARWQPWVEFAAGVLAGTIPVSPWCRLQVAALSELGTDPAAWPQGDLALLPPALPPL